MSQSISNFVIVFEYWGFLHVWSLKNVLIGQKWPISYAVVVCSVIAVLKQSPSIENFFFIKIILINTIYRKFNAVRSYGNTGRHESRILIGFSKLIKIIFADGHTLQISV